MNQLDNCDALQFVQAFEVDPTEGHLWMADTGRQFGSRVKCAPKMVIIDLETDTVKRVINKLAGYYRTIWAATISGQSFRFTRFPDRW